MCVCGGVSPPVPPTSEMGIRKETGWGGAEGDLLGSCPQAGRKTPRPLAPLLLHSTWREGLRLVSPQPLSGLCHLCPSCPGTWGTEGGRAHTGKGSPQGPRSCQVSTEKPDAVCASWKQAGERQSGMWRRQLTSGFRGSPGAPPAGPTTHGLGGRQETKRRTSECPGPTPAQICPGTAAPLGFGGVASNRPAPSRGQHRAI